MARWISNSCSWYRSSWAHLRQNWKGEWGAGYLWMASGGTCWRFCWRWRSHLSKSKPFLVSLSHSGKHQVLAQHRFSSTPPVVRRKQECPNTPNVLGALKALLKLLCALPTPSLLRKWRELESFQRKTEHALDKQRLWAVAKVHKLPVKNNEWFLWQIKKKKNTSVSKSN